MLSAMFIWIHIVYVFACVHTNYCFICVVATAGMDCCVPSYSIPGRRYWSWSGNRVFSFSDYHTNYFVSAG